MTTEEFIDTNDEYYEKLNIYFNLKQEYENKLHKKKQKILKDTEYSIRQKREHIRKIKMTCIGCNKLVGTIFTLQDNTYSAVCGSKTTPCNLHISLNRGDYIHIPSYVEDLTKLVKNSEFDMIQTKLNLLFGFITEDSMIDVFSVQKKTYTDYTDLKNRMILALKQRFEIDERETEKNIYTKELYTILSTMKTLMEEYNKTSNVQFVKDNIADYINKVLPIAQSIRNNTYLINYIESTNGTHILKKHNNIIQVQEVDAPPPEIEAFILK
jgi:hypothetical protein